MKKKKKINPMLVLHFFFPSQLMDVCRAFFNKLFYKILYHFYEKYKLIHTIKQT